MQPAQATHDCFFAQPDFERHLPHGPAPWLPWFLQGLRASALPLDNDRVLRPRISSLSLAGKSGWRIGKKSLPTSAPVPGPYSPCLSCLDMQTQNFHLCLAFFLGVVGKHEDFPLRLTLGNWPVIARPLGLHTGKPVEKLKQLPIGCTKWPERKILKAFFHRGCSRTRCTKPTSFSRSLIKLPSALRSLA